MEKVSMNIIPERVNLKIVRLNYSITESYLYDCDPVEAFFL